VDTWTCEARGGPVPQSEGETAGAAVRRHARTAGHPPASVSRQQPGGVVQRWRTPEERERERERAAETAERARKPKGRRLPEPANPAGGKGHQAGSASRKRHQPTPGWVEHRRNASTRRQWWDGLPLSTRVCVTLALLFGALMLGGWLADLTEEPPPVTYCTRPRDIC
jgi:hypothetical protein